MYRLLQTGTLPNLSRPSHRTIKSISWTPTATLSPKTVYFSPPLTKFPSKLAFIKPCRCWHLRPYVDFDTDGKHTLPCERSHRLIGDESDYLSFQTCDLEEVTVGKNGLLDPETACKTDNCALLKIRFAQRDIKLADLRFVYSLPTIRNHLLEIPVVRVVA